MTSVLPCTRYVPTRLVSHSVHAATGSLTLVLNVPGVGLCEFVLDATSSARLRSPAVRGADVKYTGDPVGVRVPPDFSDIVIRRVDGGKSMVLNAAGGAAALSRRLAGISVEISSQAISRWRRVPADRVLSVEAVTGIARHLIRPDLYPAPEGAALPPSLASSPSEPPQPSSSPAATSPAGACDIPPAGEPLQHEVV